ncbi:acyl-CoA thioesterase [Piscinibacterium candidicorallinum]|uniref:Acyl-CoA thioesterase n=1 Tax=Piscinibacterium candidicorallinum TaxID=1793872 RepID=A0ABV7H415_9BURK
MIKRSDFAFLHTLRVRWAEVDLQKVVFNGHYLTYFDVAFTEYWRGTGLPGPLAQHAAGRELYARKAGIEYHAPAHFDDLIEIGVRCQRIGNSSIRFVLAIFREAELLITGELVYVYADSATSTPQPVPADWRARLASIERQPIEGLD